MKYQNIREEELKNKVAQDYFWMYDCTKIIGNVDFAVCIHQTQEELADHQALLWAEVKKGSSDIYKSMVQLILTIGKARTFDKYLPPNMLGAFDSEKMALILYHDIHDIFYMNDFNWNITPSNHNTKEFKLIHEKVKEIINNNALLFNFMDDEKELVKFIKNNFIAQNSGLTKTKIDKNNFMIIYNKWLLHVKPTIAVNWDIAKKSNIIDGDFYLADILSHENKTLKDKLYVLLKKDHYELDRKLSDSGFFSHSHTNFKDNQIAHNQFWNKYERPPKEEYWDYIVERRDLLVPQDVRERKGSFFTPQIWVELSQKYLTDVLGDNWQDEYYVWDCAAGTGNLLAGLTNKYHIWASTLDKQDVDVMHDRIDTMNKNSVHGNGSSLLKEHVFQFDFLNDDFSKLPKPLQDIINNPEKRKKLVVYINPPYAETAKNDTKNKNRINKRGVSFTKVQKEYSDKIGIATKELFAQFLTRVFDKIPNATLAQFSKLKIVQGPNFSKFRNYFKVKFKKGFVCPSNSFDNVNGKFPIGFMIWELNNQKNIQHIKCDIFNEKAEMKGKKKFYAYDKNIFITDWFRKFHNRVDNTSCIGSIALYGSDFQHNNFINIYNVINHPNRWSYISQQNLIQSAIYFAVRKCIKATWLNDRDQFLHPNDEWQKDQEFQNNCLAFTLFNNNIQSKYGTNHWIPFTEKEVNAQEKFESNFMTDFMHGKPKPPSKLPRMMNLLFEDQKPYYTSEPLKFSKAATVVFEAGKELWKYYHKQPNCNVNAALYDMRDYFQGRNLTGKMNPKSTNETYMILIHNLREALNQLAENIEPKVYQYEFLKQ
ncbi:MAG: hypothetical protein QM539_00070 [Alphaproteobacteria bacterium]|nr:hypothetical protein [Alphaproteobacteria bacterium]